MLLALLSFAVAAALLIVLPGPDTTVVLRSIARDGRAGAVRTAAGVCCGLVVWLVVAVAGLSALLAASRTAYEVLRIVGAGYLAWLGVRTLLSLRRSGSRTDDDGGEPARRRFPRSGFVLGLATDVLNPKVGVFFVTFLPQFIPHHASVTSYTVLLGALYIAGTAAWFALLVQLGARLGRWLRRPATQRWMQRITGVALLGFAVGLVTETA